MREIITQATQGKPSAGCQSTGRLWLECAGELAHLHQATMRMEKIIEEEFEQVEAEDRT